MCYVCQLFVDKNTCRTIVTKCTNKNSINACVKLKTGDTFQIFLASFILLHIFAPEMSVLRGTLCARVCVCVFVCWGTCLRRASMVIIIFFFALVFLSRLESVFFSVSLCCAAFVERLANCAT